VEVRKKFTRFARRILNHLLDASGRGPISYVLRHQLPSYFRRSRRESDDSDYSEYLSICGFVKDERYLLEWVEYHRLVGVQKIYLYDDSVIPAQSILSRQIQEGFVEVVLARTGISQENAYAHFLKNLAHHSRWVAFIDADEFLVPITSDDVKTILRDYESYGGLAVSWLTFGSSHYITRPTGLETVNYLRRSKSNYDLNKHVKVIVQTAHTVAPAGNPHAFVYRFKYYCVNEKKRLVLGPYSENSHDLIQLNHYYLRSYSDFKEKILRGLTGVNRWDFRGWPIERFFKVDIHSNDVYDARILRFVPRLNERLDQLH
jgi:hypothetical protein